MPSNPYTTEALLRSLRLRGFLPQGSGFNTADFLQLASEEQSLYVMAMLKGIREEYVVATLDIVVTSVTVPFPHRAAGAALRSVAWVVDSGNVPLLTRIEPELRNAYPATGDRPTAFMFEGNNVILVPAATSGTLRVQYQQRLSRLVLPDACGQISAINTGTRTVTLEDDLPADFEVSQTYDYLSKYDFVSNAPNFIIRGMDYVCTSLDSGAKTLTFSADLPDDLHVGDWLCNAGETPIPQLPAEVHTLLGVRTAEVSLQGQGSARYPAVHAATPQARADAMALLAPRSDSSPRVIVRRGGPGWGGW